VFTACCLFLISSPMLQSFVFSMSSQLWPTLFLRSSSLSGASQSYSLPILNGPMMWTLLRVPGCLLMATSTTAPRPQCCSPSSSSSSELSYLGFSLLSVAVDVVVLVPRQLSDLVPNEARSRCYSPSSSSSSELSSSGFMLLSTSAPW